MIKHLLVLLPILDKIFCSKFNLKKTSYQSRSIYMLLNRNVFTFIKSIFEVINGKNNGCIFFSIPEAERVRMVLLNIVKLNMLVMKAQITC